MSRERNVQEQNVREPKVQGTKCPERNVREQNVQGTKYPFSRQHYGYVTSVILIQIQICTIQSML